MSIPMPRQCLDRSCRCRGSFSSTRLAFACSLGLLLRPPSTGSQSAPHHEIPTSSTTPPAHSTFPRPRNTAFEAHTTDHRRSQQPYHTNKRQHYDIPNTFLTGQSMFQAEDKLDKDIDESTNVWRTTKRRGSVRYGEIWLLLFGR